LDRAAVHAAHLFAAGFFVVLSFDSRLESIIEIRGWGSGKSMHFSSGVDTPYCIDLFLSRLTECSEAAVLQIHPKGLKREPNIDIGAFLIPMWTILRE
jgi:hypothetical protein